MRKIRRACDALCMPKYCFTSLRTLSRLCLVQYRCAECSYLESKDSHCEKYVKMQSRKSDDTSACVIYRGLPSINWKIKLWNVTSKRDLFETSRPLNLAAPASNRKILNVAYSGVSEIPQNGGNDSRTIGQLDGYSMKLCISPDTETPIQNG